MPALQLRPGKVPIPVRFIAYRDGDTQKYEQVDDELLLIQSLINHGALGLEKLIEMQNEGWKDEATENHFLRQRHIADNASTELNVLWFERMKGVIREIDLAVHVIPRSSDRLKFMDLGCCPGGFSSYVLDRNACASGVGVSFPPEDGGHHFSLEDHHQHRYDLNLYNLTYLQLGPSRTNNSRLLDIPSNIPEQHFDLILLDGHQLRTQVGALPWDSDRLLISQLIIAHRSIAEGGTIVVKLPLPHRLLSARVLIMLKAISCKVLAWKPRSMHANRGNCYAVAKGVGLGNIFQTDKEDVRARVDFFLEQLQHLWVELTFGGEEGNGRYLCDGEDLNFIATMEEITGDHMEWLVKLGMPLWRVQEGALSKLYLKNQRYR